MELGIVAGTFPRPTLEETLDAVAAHGLACVHFDLACLGLPTLPDVLDERLCIRIARAVRERGLRMASVSGAFNMVHPDLDGVGRNLRRLEVLAAACRWLDTRTITLRTGTADPDDPDRWHPENATRRAWNTLVSVLRSAARIADAHEVTLAIEPNVVHVVASPNQARRMLDRVASPWLKIALDPAALIHEGEESRLPSLLDEAFGLLGPDLALAYVRGFARDDEADSAGEMDMSRYIGRLCESGYDGPLVLSGLDEGQAGGCVGRLRGMLGLEAFGGNN